MKKIYVLLSLMITSGFIIAQTWTQSLDQDKLKNGELSFFEIQKAFNDYWEPYNVENGYYYENSEKIKAPGWKQFKRWEWKTENLIDGEGKFPTTSTAEEMEKYIKEFPDNGKSTSGNWSNIGYNSTNGGYQGIGRVNCIAFHPTNTSTFWIGSPSGGLWKTSDNGSTWTVLTDNNTVLGVSAIAITSNYASSNTLYIGTGDRDVGSAWSMGGGNTHDNEGVGVLKSTNGGSTWTSSLAFNLNQQVVVYDLIIDPNNNSKLYAATSNGVYYTSNAGTSWTQMTTTIPTDLEFQPGNSNVFYGAYYGYVIKYWWTGSMWTWSNVALTGSSSSRTEIAVSAINSSVVYALTVNSNGGLDRIYKSTDIGVTYTSIFNGGTGSNNLLGYNCTPSTYTGQGTYDVFITANPSNVNDLYVGGINIWRSTNGGTVWSIKSHWSTTCSGTVNVVHADQHCCEFRPGTSDVYVGNDGGIYKSTDYGSTWADLSSGLTINQIYRLGVSKSSNSEIITGLQDNGTHLYSNGWIANGVLGGDGMECLIDPYNTQIQFGEFSDGDIWRTSNHWTSSISVRNNIRNSPGGSSGLKGDWVTPYILDPNNSNNLYVGYDEVWKSTDQGQTSTNFSKISNFSTTGYIKSLQIAPSNSNYIYAGFLTTLWKTTNGGTTWTDITSGLPITSGNITNIAVKANNPNTVWVTIGGFNTYAVYRTYDGGSTWTNISTGLPQIPAMDIIQNIQNSYMDELYVAMTQGVYVKYGNSSWVPYKTGLPNVFCTELDFYYDTSTPANSRLSVATFGRGLWQSDLPVVEFYANNTLPPNATTTVTFTDASTNNPTGWYWSFSPNTVTYVGGTNSTSQNPQVRFSNTGAYTVTLTITNAYGNNSATKTNYIHMGTAGLWTGATSSAWGTTTNWHNHMVPTSSIGVTIGPTATNWPSYSGNLIVGTDCNFISLIGTSQLSVTGNLTVSANKTMACSGNAIINISGDFNNYGTFTPGNSIVNMVGTSNNSISTNSSNNGSQTTTYAAGFVPWGGCYFDIMANGPNPISINSFDIHCALAGPVSVQVWYTMGSYVGNTGNPGAWTQLGTTQNVNGVGFGSPTPVNPGASLTIQPGMSYGFYVNCYDGGGNGQFYFSLGNNLYVNADITMNTGDISNAFPVGSGSLNGYTFNGTVYYSSVTQNVLSLYDLMINNTNASSTTVLGQLNVNNDLIITQGSKLTNSQNSGINITGNFLIDGNPSGTSSFVDFGSTSVGGTTSVNKNYTDNRWHNVSVPLNNEVSGVFSGLYLYGFDETTFTWTNIYGTTTPLNPGQGYLIWSTVGNPTISFTNGLLNVGDYSPTLSYTDQNSNSLVDANEGWNMLGNAFPSAIDITASGYTWTSLTNTIYMYNGTQYASYNRSTGVGNPASTTQYVPSMQGFFVKVSATSPTPTLTIPNAARLHSNQANYKSNEIIDEIRLEVTGNGYNDEMLLLTMEGATPGFDVDFDAYKLYGIEEAPQLYTFSLDDKMAVNTFDNFYPETIIPVAVEVSESGLYTLTFSSLTFANEEMKAYLEDLKNGDVYEIFLNKDYVFPMSANDEPHRFNIHFESPTDIENVVSSQLDIYSYGKTFYFSKVDDGVADVFIYNILGEMIYSTSYSNSNFSISLNESQGYYLVKVIVNGKIISKKLLID